MLHDLILGLERDSWNERDTEDGDDADDGDHDHNSATDTLKHIITIHHIYLLHTFKFTTPGMCLKCVRNDYHPMNTDQSYARKLSLNYPLYLVCLYVPHTYVQGQKRDCRTTEKNRVTDLFRQTNIIKTLLITPNQMLKHQQWKLPNIPTVTSKFSSSLNKVKGVPKNGKFCNNIRCLNGD